VLATSAGPARCVSPSLTPPRPRLLSLISASQGLVKGAAFGTWGLHDLGGLILAQAEVFGHAFDAYGRVMRLGCFYASGRPSRWEARLDNGKVRSKKAAGIRMDMVTARPSDRTPSGRSDSSEIKPGGPSGCACSGVPDGVLLLLQVPLVRWRPWRVWFTASFDLTMNSTFANIGHHHHQAGRWRCSSTRTQPTPEPIVGVCRCETRHQGHAGGHAKGLNARRHLHADRGCRGGGSPRCEGLSPARDPRGS
jgi:hypothetical protein